MAADMANAEKVAAISQHEDNEKFRERGIDSTLMDLGSRKKLKNEKELIYFPAETDVSIRPGWFYHPEDDDKVKSFEELKEIYLRCVGGNTMLLLNVPPTKEGLLHEKDVKVLKELGEFIRTAFSNNLVQQAQMSSIPGRDIRGNSIDVVRRESYDTYFENPQGERELKIIMKWDELQTPSYIVLKEEIAFSQRVEEFTISYRNENGEMEEFYQGTVIGHKKIVEMENIKTKEIQIHITDARVAPILSFVGVYGK